jgi:hypothetical protein
MVDDKTAAVTNSDNGICVQHHQLLLSAWTFSAAGARRDRLIHRSRFRSLSDFRPGRRPGAGLGASHQTGWAGVIARVTHLFAKSTAEEVLKLGQKAALAETGSGGGLSF